MTATDNNNSTIVYIDDWATSLNWGGPDTSEHFTLECAAVEYDYEPERELYLSRYFQWMMRIAGAVVGWCCRIYAGCFYCILYYKNTFKEKIKFGAAGKRLANALPNGQFWSGFV